MAVMVDRDGAQHGLAFRPARLEALRRDDAAMAMLLDQHVRRRQRAAIDIALDMATPKVSDQREFVLRFRPLARGVHAPRFGPAHDLLDDRAVGAALFAGAPPEAPDR